MKYRANSQDTWHKIKVKALDGMPVGSIVDFDGQASDIPSGWEQVSDNIVVLYDNSTGAGQEANITLSDNAFNYSRIDILYSTDKSDYGLMNMTTYPNVNNKWEMIWNWQEAGWGGILGQKITYNTSGTTYQITRGTTTYVGGNYQGWSTFWTAYSDGIKIYKVIGYK